VPDGAVRLAPSEAVAEGLFVRITVGDTLGHRPRVSQQWRANTNRRPADKYNKDPSWLHLPGSGWLCTARSGSRKRITRSNAVQRPLHHGSQRSRGQTDLGSCSSGRTTLRTDLPYTSVLDLPYSPYRPAVHPPY